MVRVVENRSRKFRAVALLGALLVLALGTAQAIHTHPDNSQTSHHFCSICSAPSLGPAATTVSGLPAVQAIGVTALSPERIAVFRPASSFYIRPPPAA
jgi:hypothetical protein